MRRLSYSVLPNCRRLFAWYADTRVAKDQHGETKPWWCCLDFCKHPQLGPFRTGREVKKPRASSINQTITKHRGSSHPECSSGDQNLPVSQVTNEGATKDDCFCGSVLHWSWQSLPGAEMSFNSLGPNGCECVKSNVWKNSFTARQLMTGDDQSVNVQNNFSLIQVKDHNHAYTDCTCLSYIHTFDLKSWAFILLSDIFVQ